MKYEDFRKILNEEDTAFIERVEFFHEWFTIGEVILVGDIADTEDAKEWCSTHLNSWWGLLSDITWAFHDPLDAMLFKLTWGGSEPLC